MCSAFESRLVFSSMKYSKATQRWVVGRKEWKYVLWESQFRLADTPTPPALEWKLYTWETRPAFRKIETGMDEIIEEKYFPRKRVSPEYNINSMFGGKLSCF